MKPWLTLILSTSALVAMAEAPRPSEADIFGAPTPPPKAQKGKGKKAAAAKAPVPGTGPAAQGPAPSLTPPPAGRNDADELNKPNVGRDAFASGEVTDNPLQIGGTYYQRVMISGQDGVRLGDTPVSAPLQFDGFLDARPNDRLRGYIDARLFYDPSAGSFGSFQNSTTSAAPTTFNATTGSATQVALDQAWLKFDIDRTVYATIGKQHVKWGVSRFWNPTDLLSTQKRDPLLPYDLRLGNYMAKFMLPFEGTKTNLSAIALFDNPNSASKLGQLGAAMRAETVIFGAEVGVDAIFRNGAGPVYGADLSSGLGPFDVYAEAALLTDPGSIYVPPQSIAAGTDIGTILQTAPLQKPAVQVSTGINYSFGWKENRQATIGFEYFYNQAGYDDAHAYPILIFTGQYRPFYTGVHYAAVYLTAEGPDEEKRTNYTFSTIGNFSDGSFISRLDFSWRVLTYLTFEAYADGHYGTTGGEFKFGLSTPSLTYQGNTIAPINLPASTFDVGLGLRISF